MESKALKNINLHIQEGEFIVIAGPSGCGKTTLLRLLKKELNPVGYQEGEIYYQGKLLDEWSERELIKDIGFVFQNPDEQIVMDEVMQEIVFGLENLNYSTLEMRKRVSELVHFFGLEELLYEKPSELSGGQKQMINLLSVLLLRPKVLLLDEPTSQLDPVAAKELLNMLKQLNEELGITIVLVEHRLEHLFSIADRILMMKDGEVFLGGDSKEVILQLHEAKKSLFLPYIPTISQLYLERESTIKRENIPLTVKESRSWLRNLPPVSRNEQEVNPLKKAEEERLPILQADNLFFRYDPKGYSILRNFSLTVNEGDFYTLVGGNGSGKTTALKVCLGIVKQQRGKLKLFNKRLTKRTKQEVYRHIAYLPQDPKAYFSYDTIVEEMMAIVHTYKIQNGEEKVNHMLKQFQIEHLKERHPYDCSGGEMQKAALASMLLKEPKLLIVDEPTKGFDPAFKEEFATLLKKLHKKGLTILMVTHDIEFAARYANRCGLLFDGEIAAEGPPKQLFQGNYFYTTAINRATRDQNIPEVLTLEEALKKWPQSKHQLI